MGAAMHWKWFVRERAGRSEQQSEDDDADADYAYPDLVSHVTCYDQAKTIGLRVVSEGLAGHTLAQFVHL